VSAQNLFTNRGDGWKCDFEVLFFQLTAENKILDLTTEPIYVAGSPDTNSSHRKEGIA
jgi:hypothetical protein